MRVEACILFVLAMSLPDNVLNITVTDYRVIKKGDKQKTRTSCETRIDLTMSSMGKRRGSPMDLTGYALHQSLRSAPFDMYVTNMKVHIPHQSTWYYIDKCQFYPHNKTLSTHVSLRDISVSGMVKLFYEETIIQDPLLPVPTDVCNMTLKLRRAEFQAAIQPKYPFKTPFQVQLDMNFVPTDVISVYAYGCYPSELEHREAAGEPQGKFFAKHDLSQEVEDVLVKGIQSLIKSYLGKNLQQTLKDMLMVNMGYTLSYGR